MKSPLLDATSACLVVYVGQGEPLLHFRSHVQADRRPPLSDDMVPPRASTSCAITLCHSDGEAHQTATDEKLRLRVEMVSGSVLVVLARLACVCLKFWWSHLQAIGYLSMFQLQ